MDSQISLDFVGFVDVIDVWFNVTTPEHPMKHARFRPANVSWIATPQTFAQMLTIAVLFTIARYLCTKYIYLPICNLCKFYQEDYPRFVESAWQLVYYLPSWVLCAYIVIPAPYFKETWRTFEDPFPFQPIDEPTYWLFVISFGWYAHCLYAHIYLDPRKKDYWEMLVHHVTALSLIYLALVKGYFRFGTLTIFCMDLCDVFLHTCKILRIVDNVFVLPNLFKNLMFATLPVSWILFRLILFANKVLYTALFQSYQSIGWSNCDYYILFNVMLCTIFLLQVIWFYYIMKIVVKHVFSGEEYDDVRDPHCKRAKVH